MLRPALTLWWCCLAVTSCAAATQDPVVTDAPRATSITVVRDTTARPWTDEEEQRQVVDHRYAPATWDTAICLPDDPQKTLVSEKGELLIDYPGSYTRFRTRIGVDYGVRTIESQDLFGPAVPLITTSFGGGDIAPLTSVAFAAPPDAELPMRATSAPSFFRAVGPQRAERGWGKAQEPGYHDIVVGWNDTIAYRFPAPEEGGTLLVGFIESHHREAGVRRLEVFLEGESRGVVDPVEAHGTDVPFNMPLEVADADGDGTILLEVRCTEDSPDQNAILAALWLKDSDGQIVAHLDCGAERSYSGPPRADVLRVTKSGEESIRIIVDSQEDLVPDAGGRHVLFGDKPFIAFTSPWVDVEHEGERWIFSFDPGERTVAAVVASGFEVGDVDIRWVLMQEYYCRSFWEDLDLPYEVITVPDPGIQRLLTTSIRNIWQAREMKDGLPSFQVGPTCYRGLWVVDGAFLLEAVTFLGRGEEARAGIDHLLSYQKDDGSFELLRSYWKENGIVLYIMHRHALLTGDRAWLEERWPVVEGIVAAIVNLRERSRENPDAIWAGLLPPGYPDGGVGGVVPEYTNVYWCLAGLRAAARSAALLGKREQAKEWRAEYEDMYAAFEAASMKTRIERDDGSYALPILMEPTEAVAPVRGQWAFCHALYPGQVFSPSDPLVRGNLALMAENESEGLVLGTGWLEDGIWNYFASFYAHALLWAGNGEKAADVLYAFANHASPLGAWREEQMPRGQDERLVGDMPHNWASAEFIRLTRDLLALEREDELHLLEGMPRAWLKPGSITSLEGAATNFGPLDLVLYVDETLRQATLLFAPPQVDPPSQVVVHLGAWAAEASPVREMEDGWYEVTIDLAD